MRHLLEKNYTKFLMLKYQEKLTLLGEVKNFGCEVFTGLKSHG